MKLFNLPFPSGLHCPCWLFSYLKQCKLFSTLEEQHNIFSKILPQLILFCLPTSLPGQLPTLGCYSTQEIRKAVIWDFPFVFANRL